MSPWKYLLLATVLTGCGDSGEEALAVCREENPDANGVIGTEGCTYGSAELMGSSAPGPNPTPERLAIKMPTKIVAANFMIDYALQTTDDSPRVEVGKVFPDVAANVVQEGNFVGAAVTKFTIDSITISGGSGKVSFHATMQWFGPISSQDRFEPFESFDVPLTVYAGAPER